jgi:glycosyltransferase involved in cell wall biosynthesis
MISVCIATFNGSKYIEEQLHSILPQLEIADEIIISDDHSTDDTINLIEQISDNRIKVIYNTGERGYTKNFENAIINARGEIIILSDQDDFWLPGKVNILKKELINHDFVVSNGIITDNNLLSYNLTYFDLRGTRQGFFANLIKARYLGCCMAFKCDIKSLILPFPRNTIYAPHDYWITLVCEFYLKTSVVQESLILYRRHDNNVSTGGNESNFSFLIKVKYRLYCLFQVIKRFKMFKELCKNRFHNK